MLLPEEFLESLQQNIHKIFRYENWSKMAKIIEAW